MMTGKEVLDLQNRIKVPAKFPFPFPPYNIQEDFMTSLFNTLNKGQLGIFESPTGTGKSLSLICGTLAWFKEYQKQRKLHLEAIFQDFRRLWL